ncbi:MAG: MotA/TolQ/ExbB proton channel family protein [Oscillospiraceae bacterium]|nr:MotA/TolQ/ExbB proton channel family protein [Oscillospiraceae bacterium]
MPATTTEETFAVSDILRAVSERLETPVVVILIILILAAVVLLGWLIAEWITERRHLKVELPKLLDEMQAGDNPLQDVITQSGLLGRQKEALLELTRHPKFDATMREALAIRLIEQEQARYDRVLRFSELVARLGPMFGLLGTLIPLGPGIIALGQGDTFTLSSSLLTAFDTTIAGLLAAAVATVISTVRRAWYKDYMSTLEALASCVLELLKEEQEVTCDAEIAEQKAQCGGYGGIC